MASRATAERAIGVVQATAERGFGVVPSDEAEFNTSMQSVSRQIVAKEPAVAFFAWLIMVSTALLLTPVHAMSIIYLIAEQQMKSGTPFSAQ